MIRCSVNTISLLMTSHTLYTQIYENLSKYYIAAHETYHIISNWCALWYNTPNTPQTAVVAITGTRNHLQTTCNLNHLEIKYVPRVLQVGGTANVNLFFSLLDTKLTRIDDDDDDDVSLTIFPFTSPPPPAISLQGAKKYRYNNNVPITRYTPQ